MALDQAKILFKKFIGGVSSTNNDSPYFNEIAGATNPNVGLSRLWMLSQRIPLANPFLPADPDGTLYGASVIPEAIDILEKVVVRLYRIQGTGGLTAAYAETDGDTPDAPAKDWNQRRFRNLINSFVYGSDYAIEILDTGGSAINIYTPDNDGFVDIDSGVLSFNGSNIYNDTFVDVVGYSYIGPRGDDAGLDMYAKLIAASGGSGNTGSGIEQIYGKATRVGGLPAAGDAYNGLYYLVNDGDGGTPADPIRFDITFDYGNTWHKRELGALDDTQKYILIPSIGSFNDNQFVTYDHASLSLILSTPTRNSLVYVQTNNATLKNEFNVDDLTYTSLEDLYYQYSDNGTFEPKSFEKTANVEIVEVATVQTIEDSQPTGVVLNSRNSSTIDFVEVTKQYNVDSGTQKILNRNAFKLYLNGQKIDLFDNTDGRPVFGGNNPLDDYDDFSAAFGDFTPIFPIVEGNELGASPNQFHIDLTAGDANVDEFFGVNDITKRRLDNEFNIKRFPEDLDVIDYNHDFYDDEYSALGQGEIYPFFFVEITDTLSAITYRKVTSYIYTVTGDSVEFTYEGTDLSGTTIVSTRLIYYKRPMRVTGGETLFWLPTKATYEVEPGDEFNLNYLGDLEKSVILRDNYNNLVDLP